MSRKGPRRFPAGGATALQERSLEQITGLKEEVNYDSYLVREYVRAWKTPLKELDAEQLRILMSQGSGWPHVALRAQELLADDPWQEVDVVPGALLLHFLNLVPQGATLKQTEVAAALELAKRAKALLSQFAANDEYWSSKPDKETIRVVEAFVGRFNTGSKAG